MRGPDEGVKRIPVPLHSTLGPRVHMGEDVLVGWPPWSLNWPLGGSDKDRQSRRW